MKLELTHARAPIMHRPCMAQNANRVACAVHLTEHGMLYVSGHGPNLQAGGWVQGKVGEDMSVEDARKAARLTGLAMLATVENALGETPPTHTHTHVRGD